MSRFLKLVVPAVCVIAADQVTKALALRHLEGSPRDLIEGAVTLRLTYNSGGVFGLLQGRPGFFLVATILVSGAILWWGLRIEDRRMLVPLGLVLGGGVGNLADRLFRSGNGEVVDFIDLHVWPVFNLADAAIVTGVGLILLLSLRRGRAEP